MAKPLLARLRTRLVWWWERFRIPGFRERIWSLPPLPARPSAGAELLLFAPAVGLTDAAWAARSLLRQLPDLRLCFALDDPPSQVAPAHARLQQLFPGVEVHSAPELALTCRPRLAAFAKTNAMGRKLAAVTARLRDRAVLYADSDVLAFARLPEIETALTETRPTHIQCVISTCLDDTLHRRSRELGLELCPNLNGGFYLTPAGGFDEPLIERLLEGVDPSEIGWFGETVVTAGLLHELGSQPLPRDRYVVSTAREFVGEADVDYDRIALRHFVTPVRPLFYRRGLPRLWAQWEHDRK